jgi:hypothetical protein
LLRELDAGLAWESATQAVAEGTAKRFGSANRPVKSVSLSTSRGASLGRPALRGHTVRLR